MDSTSKQTDRVGILASDDGSPRQPNRRHRRAVAATIGGLAVATVVVLGVSSWGGDDDAPVERLSTSGAETAGDGAGVTEPTAGTARPSAPTRASTVAKRPAPAAAGTPAITIDPSAVQAGEQEVRVHGRNWVAGSPVNVRLVEPQPARAEFISFDVTADAEGTFLARFIVPAYVLPGGYLVEALGSHGGSAIVGLTVAPWPPEVTDDGDDGLGAAPCLDDLGQPCDEDCVNDPGIDEGCDPPDGGVARDLSATG